MNKEDHDFYLHQPARDPRAIERHHSWKFGFGPEDDIARGEGFTPTTIIIDPPVEHDPYDDVTGTETKMKCPRCRAPMYVVDQKYKGEVIADDTAQGEVPENILMLRCPQCKYYLQMRESALRIINQRRGDD